MELTQDEIRRMTYIGSRDVSAILGVSKYESAYDVWNFKKNGIKRFISEEQMEMMRWGLLLEDILLAEYSTRNNTKIIEKQKHIRHASYEFLGGTLDAIVRDEFNNGILVEAKTTNNFNKNYDDDIPDDCFIQVQWLMGLSNLSIAHVPVLIGGQKLKHHVVEFDKDIFNLSLERCINFWNKYVIGNSEIYNPKNIIEPIKDSKICADKVVLNWISELKSIKNKKKSLDEQEKFYENAIKEFMGKNEILCDSNFKNLASWKDYERASLDNDAVKKYLGEKKEEFVKKSKYRMFKIN